MSTFGDGTFKQGVYEEIQWRMKDRNLTPSEAVSEVLEVCQWMMGCFDYNSEVYKKAKEDAKAELIAELKGK